MKEVLHGAEIVDPYRWLEDQKSLETRAWIDAQNEYTQSRISSLPGRKGIEERLAELLKVEAIGVPQVRSDRYFFTKRRANQDLSVLYLRKGLQGADEVLIDPHVMSPDHTVSVSLQGVSNDGSLLAYGIRHGGEDEIAIQLFDAAARKDLPDRLPKGRLSSVSIKPDKSGFYYTRLSPEGDRLYYHAMGADPTRDAEVYGKGIRQDQFLVPALSEDGRYLVVHVAQGSAWEKSEIYIQDLTHPGPLVPIIKDLPARFFGRIAGSQLFVSTNWKAPHGRVLAVDLQNSAPERWREIVPESDGVIEDCYPVAGKLFVQYTQNASSRLRIYEPDGTVGRELLLPAIGSVTAFSGRWGGKEAFFSFTSFHIPTTIYRYDVAREAQEVWARVNVPIESEQFEIKQVWYESKDKTKVPMFLVYRKGLKLDGSNPTLLTGYGGFNVSETPTFTATAALWAERAGVFALTNMRGGGEFGEKWHRAGMLANKQNVFDDFIAAAEWLIANRYTQASKLAVTGRSNGGLLVGAALTQHPELFQAVVCGYPLLDMVRYHKFLIARYWVPEYGSSEDPAQFQYLYAYSPYHHVRPGTKYPAVLLITGDSDTRVDPLHARKMTALLQAATASDRPILLHYDTKAGHVAGGQPVAKQIQDLTDELGFLFWQLSVAPERRN